MPRLSAGVGGHTGHMFPFAFVSSFREFFDGAGIIGGGIANGAVVAGAVTSGADLVYMGTRFLAALRSLAPGEYMQMMVDHCPVYLVISGAIVGTRASWQRPRPVANRLDPVDLQSLGAGAAYTYGA